MQLNGDVDCLSASLHATWQPVKQTNEQTNKHCIPTNAPASPHFGAISRSPAVSLKSPAFLFC